MANNKIHQRGENPTMIELPAGGAVLPGHLVMTNSSGQLVVHGTAGGTGETCFAQEDALQGRTVTDTYNTADPVTAFIEKEGNLTLATLKAGFAYTPATQLISAGDGTLKPTTGTPAKVFGNPVASIDLSASGAVNTLSSIRCW